MSRTVYPLLVLQALWELIWYDVLHSVLGFHYICRQLERQRVVARPRQPEAERRVREAMSLAQCFYWKRVYCLQRAVVAARLLRKSGVSSRVVIGYQPTPFFSHAWVEVNGRVVNDSPIYKERMYILCSF